MILTPPDLLSICSIQGNTIKLGQGSLTNEQAAPMWTQHLGSQCPMQGYNPQGKEQPFLASVLSELPEKG